MILSTFPPFRTTSPSTLCFKFQFSDLFETSPKCVISTGAKRNGEIFAPKSYCAVTIMRRSLDYARDDALRMVRSKTNCSINWNFIFVIHLKTADGKTVCGSGFCEITWCRWAWRHTAQPAFQRCHVHSKRRLPRRNCSRKLPYRECSWNSRWW